MTSKDICRLMLERKGYTVTDWARGNGYSPNAVFQMLWQWEDRQDGHPGGQRALMALDLSLAIGEPIFPSIETQVHAMIAKNRGHDNGTESR